jgi:hypothetical protein
MATAFKTHTAKALAISAPKTHLRFDSESSKLFLSPTLTVVAWVNANFHLSVESRIDIRCRVDASHGRERVDTSVTLSFSSSRPGRGNVFNANERRALVPII